MTDEELKLQYQILHKPPKGELFRITDEVRPIVGISYNWEEIIHIREETGLSGDEIIEILNKEYLPKTS